MVDKGGIPLTVLISAANVHDCQMLEKLVDAVPLVYIGKRGAPRRRPDKLHADKA